VQKGVQCDAALVNVAGTQGIEQSQARGWAVAENGLARHGVCNSKGPTNITGGRLWNVYRRCNYVASLRIEISR
jgi:hypothetical protein